MKLFKKKEKAGSPVSGKLRTRKSSGQGSDASSEQDGAAGLQGQLHEARSVAKEHSMALRAAERELRESLAREKKLKEEVEELRSSPREGPEINGNLAEVQNQLREARVVMKVAEVERNDAEERVHELEIALSKREMEISELQNKLEGFKKQETVVKLLESKNSENEHSLQKQLTESRADAKENSLALKATGRERDNAESRANQLEIALSQREIELNGLKRELDDLRGSLSKENTAKQELQKILSKTQSELAEAREQLSKAQQRRVSETSIEGRESPLAEDELKSLLSDQRKAMEALVNAVREEEALKYESMRKGLNKTLSPYTHAELEQQPRSETEAPATQEEDEHESLKSLTL